MIGLVTPTLIKCHHVFISIPFIDRLDVQYHHFSVHYGATHTLRLLGQQKSTMAADWD